MRNLYRKKKQKFNKRFMYEKVFTVVDLRIGVRAGLG